MAQSASDPTRLLGKYYTPGFLVEAMLRLVLDPLLQSRRPDGDPPLRILDPACGEGAFLIAVRGRLKRWYERNGFAPDSVAASHLFGVDVDRSALERLRIRLAGMAHDSPGGEANLRWGDSLTGPGFGEQDGAAIDGAVPDLDWSAAFPQVAEEGGFDLVLGNPPYRREVDSKPSLDRLRQSSLGRRWHRARLDLWTYFLHRGLDLLKAEGRLAYILPSYWTASTAARQLIDRLEAEATIREVILLGRSPVFPEVEGWHLILSLTKGRCEEPCRVWDLSESGKRIAADLASIPASDRPRPDGIEQAELYRQGQLHFTPPDARLRLFRRPECRPLSERFEVRQGIVENPRRISRAMAAQSSGRFRAGEGVFVLSPEERDRLRLSPEEQQLLRPYYRGSDIERYGLAETPAEFLLYLTRESAPSLEPFPQIEAHLARFRPLLENRREVRNGQIAWWHLHWPRQESLFLSPRILMPQMGHAPRFVFCERPAFVGFAMHVVRLKSFSEDAIPLAALAGPLNSERAVVWFRRFAKHRGVALDISGSLLKRFPLPPPNPEAEAAVGRLVLERQNLGRGDPRRLEREAEIESLVRKWYES